MRCWVQTGSKFTGYHHLTNCSAPCSCWLVLLLTDVSEHADHLHHNGTDSPFNTIDMHRTRRSASSYQCSRSNIVGMLVQKSSAYLFPCTIEYSLICAVTLYEMWKDIKIPPVSTTHHHRCSHTLGRDYSNNSLGKIILARPTEVCFLN